MDITQRGEIYGIGQGDDFYGIWDLRAEGAPVNRYPKTPEGWQGAWERWRELEGGHGRPGWRATSAGMVLLHMLIGLVIGIAASIFAGVILGAAGRDLEGVDSDGQAQLGLVAILQWILTLAAWMLFVYLPTRAAVRWVSFLALLFAAIGLTVGVGFAFLPEA